MQKYSVFSLIKNAFTDENSIAPIIAVPTTAGTGSETGRASAIGGEQLVYSIFIRYNKFKCY